MSELSPLFTRSRLNRGRLGTSVSGRYCCKSPENTCDRFSAKRRNKPQSPIDAASSPSRKSPVSSSRYDVTPYMFIRTSRLQLENFVISCRSQTAFPRSTSTRSARGIAQQGGVSFHDTDLAEEKKNCLDSEPAIRDELVKQWSSFSPADKTACTNESKMGGESSYTELLTCLEMARDVRATGAKPTFTLPSTAARPCRRCNRVTGPSTAALHAPCLFRVKTRHFRRVLGLPLSLQQRPNCCVTASDATANCGHQRRDMQP